MSNISARLAKLESTASRGQSREVRQFAIEGPGDMPEGASIAFLRSCGHDVRDEDLNIVRVFIGAEDGRPVDLPLRDLTAEHRPAASTLHLQRPALR